MTLSYLTLRNYLNVVFVDGGDGDQHKNHITVLLK